MRIAVAGGTGVLGRHVVAALERAGHEPVVIARSRGIDLTTGAGLTDALSGVDAVVDASNVTTARGSVARRFFETVTTNLIAAAREAGVGHLVVVSIIGIDRVPYGYYRAKERQEELLRAAPIPVSILRAAQFHDFPGQLLARLPGPVAVIPRWQVQPVAASEVGVALADLASGDPVPTSEMAGPEVTRMADLVRRLLRAEGSRKPVLEFRAPGGMGRAAAAGGNLPTGEVRLGEQTFNEWLASRS
ncbi:SDR family oxidoreductase [Nocardioides sp.]|uniref:SDR family oxidoreductase n=1 Tax=Nocardioides sp. TaxID=35761 RepID=UPI0039E63519